MLKYIYDDMQLKKASSKKMTAILTKKKLPSPGFLHKTKYNFAYQRMLISLTCK